ncbi:Rossmann-like and DUF2520 domain-containing protein [Aneurinibacillus aneurinilyticus]|uniref:Phosphogluconate dehydrogenase, NAD binding domain protein n=1 Tax=Aneurinibacillus aneurinilyticus ATCC 12856 TaxID=649747 RepID=U1Y551_ANEAE|nr:DUF2520 domain-containing protein [Aneurinibacillus aneurinilyticus]ERI06026.1 phosphogluconate dehydrogenase, NAD binding domain protein [Aneurinibacillus aneurinilyticus ATCC 12856]MED0705114.1 DUF2520 domain-containing protein [Aneurinibacillus aneurinilyticus]MED0721773.1 DUF2520 domain-containing protein [Aneurinibacillus aneurinilyticus]MED0731897.1 DUF2520 domain-containing protein [Aneurinibacillus aneurinilyticus]MED0740522.1 DUF2520 domain-containing protein [Aneurinibacillus aneu
MKSIGFIGAGRLGTAFGLYLMRREIQVAGYYSRTYAHAKDAADLLGGEVQAFCTLEELLERSDWVAIAANDGAIAQIAETIAGSEAHIKGKVVFHMSGAATSALLAPLANKGALVASLHPLQSFADGISGARAMEEAVFGVEGDNEAVVCLSKWVKNLGHTYFVLDAEYKPLYHAAASVASNSLAGVIGYAVELMMKTGMDEEKSLSALSPLIKTTVCNVLDKGAARALTGPVVRGDVGTVAMHLQALDKMNPELVSFYKELGKLTLATAKREQLRDGNVICQLNKLLE